MRAGRLGADLIGPRSDFAPFRDRRVPFLFFCTGWHKDYHRPTDLPGRLNYKNLARVSRWIAALTEKLADANTAPTWAAAEPEPDLEEARTVLNVLTQVLKRPDRLPLSDAQRWAADNLRKGLEGIVQRGRFTREERQGLVRLAELLKKMGP